MRVFVYHSDSYLGQVLCEKIRTDHEVIGTVRDPNSPGKYLKEVIPSDNLEALKKALLSADLIVYQLLEETQDACILATKIMESATFDSQKSFVLVSSALSWAKTKKSNEGKEESQDGDSTNEYEPFTEDQAVTRKPHDKFKNFIEVEKRVKRASSKFLQTYVLFSGLMYGMGEDLLHPWFKQAWLGHPAALPCFYQGNNYLPTIHVCDLASIIMGVVETKPEQKYIFAVDESKNTQIQIVQAISSALGTGKVAHLSETEVLLHENTEHFTLDIKLDQGVVAELEFDWKSKGGLVENIAAIVSEYCECRKVTPLKICVLGAPASGKSTTSALLAKHYRLEHLRVANVIQEFLEQEKAIQAEIDQLNAAKAQLPRENTGDDDDDAAAEEPEEDEAVKEQREKLNAKLEKLNEIKAMKDEKNLYKDEALARMYRWKLSQMGCRNQGFILDGFPKTAAQARLLFRARPFEGEEVIGDGEDEEEDGEEAEAGGEGAAVEAVKSMLAHPLFMPEFLVVLDVQDENILRKRLMDMRPEEIIFNHNTEEAFNRRIAVYRANNNDINGVVPFIEAMVSKRDKQTQVLTREIRIASESKDEVLNKVIDFVGEPHNYGPTREEIEAQEMEKRRIAEEERQRLLAEEEKRARQEKLAQLEKQKRAKEEAARLSEIIKQEKEMLEIRSAPLRSYLMEHVIPILTQGLIEVCQVHPEDPVDYLAEYLFKNNPVQEEEDN